MPWSTGSIVVEEDAIDHMSEELVGRPLPMIAGSAGSAPGALESLVDTASEDECSVASVGGVTGGEKPVM